MLWQPSAEKGKGNYRPMFGFTVDFHWNTQLAENIITRFSEYPKGSKK